ncbi:MAG TPA: LuxR C-terminal-related transcriptional regulator [Candidatus Limnocylindria bacterium]|nr:LuxR C-terminal-related transcriptional regulator [Candidatus Limnocylindria bacterium]
MPARFSSERFVGRERELSHLAVALEAAAEGRSPRLIVSGRGGAGASRLVSEAVRRVGLLNRPFQVVRCTAVAARNRAAYGPIIEGFRPWLDSLEQGDLEHAVGPGAEPIARLLPAIAPRLAGEIRHERRASIAPERRSAWVSEAIQGLLERAGERRPILLILEDLDHADAGTRNLATFLARVARPSRVCLVLTYGRDRLSRGHPLLPQLASISGAADPPTQLELGPLDRFDLAQLVTEIEGERPTAAALLLVAERSGGDPLIAEEVLAARRELPGLSLGSTLDELVLARLGRRAAECRRVLRLLAPAGRPLDRGELAAVATTFEGLVEGLPPRSTTRPRRGDGVLDADLRAGVTEAIDHGFLVERPDHRLELRHELVAQAIEADLLPVQRRRHHLALAAALGTDPASALTHWLAAYEPARARAAALATAAVAENLDSAADALAARELALELGAASGARAADGRLLFETAEVALAAGRADRALAYLETAAGRFGEREDAEIAAAIYEMLGRVSRALGDHDRALAEHRRAASILPEDATPFRAEVLASLAQTLMLLGHFNEATRVGRQAIAVAREVGEAARSVEAHALCTVGIAQAWGASGDEGIGQLREALRLARELDDPDVAFRAALNLSTALALFGRRDDAIEVTREAVEKARADGLEVAYGNSLRGNIAEALFNAGRWQEARDTIRTALEWSPDAVAFADASVTAAMLEVETSVDERAASLLGWQPLEIDHAPDPQLEVPATRAAASFALWRGDVVDARRAVERGWALVRRAEDWALTARMAATYLEVQSAVATDARERHALPEISGSRQRGKRVLAEAETVLRSSGVAPGAPSRHEADANISTARAYAARLEGRDDPVLWDAAAQGWERAGEPYQVARARWRQAEAALPGRDARVARAAARGPLLAAARIARELGARPLLRELTNLATRAMITLPETESTERQGATSRATGASAGSGRGAENGEVTRGRPIMAGRAASAHGEPIAARISTEPSDVDSLDGVTDSGIAAAFAPEDRGSRQKEAFGLSRREREVLALIAEGRTNREIGERLFISQKTVGVHVGNILAKLGASGRVEAAMVAIRLELVPTPLAGRQALATS